MTVVDTLAEQRTLKAAGFDPGPLDGMDGPKTRAARAAFADSQAHSIHWVPDARSATQIATLLPRVQLVAVELLRRLAGAGISAKVISGTRSWEEQAALYAQGRTVPGPRVTNARAGYSNHNFGIAFDIGIFEGGRYLEDTPAYRQAGAIGKSLGLDWGGDWKGFRDEPHFELRPPWAQQLTGTQMLAQFRARKLQGKELWS